MLMDESRCMPSADFLQMQPHVAGWMRGRLIDWLIDVHQKFGFQQVTLFLAVSIIDRHLSRSEMCTTRLQLLGATAILIAAKFEEVSSSDLSPPTVVEVV